MRFLFSLLCMIVVALAVGFGLSYYTLTDGRLIGARQGRSLGRLARRRLLLARSLYPRLSCPHRRAAAWSKRRLAFAATGDSDGQPLDRDCRYRISGTTPVASFWTLRAVDAGGRDIARPDGQQALRSRERGPSQ